MNEMSKPPVAAAINATEHWTTKDGGVKLFLFEKVAGDPAKTRGTIERSRYRGGTARSR